MAVLFLATCNLLLINKSNKWQLNQQVSARIALCFNVQLSTVLLDALLDIIQPITIFTHRPRIKADAVVSYGNEHLIGVKRKRGGDFVSISVFDDIDQRLAKYSLDRMFDRR